MDESQKLEYFKMLQDNYRKSVQITSPKFSLRIKKDSNLVVET